MVEEPTTIVRLVLPLVVVGNGIEVVSVPLVLYSSAKIGVPFELMTAAPVPTRSTTRFPAVKGAATVPLAVMELVVPPPEMEMVSLL